jgi:cation diffusion facilitator CzcD-associated flavoprotein CzcO
MPTSSSHDYEAIVIGAGVAGIYQIKRLIDLGIDATVLDAAPDTSSTTPGRRSTVPSCVRWWSAGTTTSCSHRTPKQRASGRRRPLPRREADRNAKDLTGLGDVVEIVPI